MPAQLRREEDEHDQHDKKVVGEQQEILADSAKDVDHKRQLDLLNNALCACKGGTGITNHVGDHEPSDIAYGEVGEIGLDLLAEQPSVERTHAENQHPSADREPKWPQCRASVALPDFL